MDTATILIIDDNENQTALSQNLNSSGLVTTQTLHPNDIGLDDLRNSDLLLVDYQLDVWPERDAIEQISLKPRDGLALSSNLRGYSNAFEKDSPTAIAILTGNIDKLASPLPYENREHVLAHLHNLEWVFQKAKPDEKSRLTIQLVDLAQAVKSLPPRWSDKGSEALPQLTTLLGFDQDDSANQRLVEDVEGCAPPIHELSEWSHGLAVLRWILHRILPYPCFLWDTNYVAARLTLDHDGFVLALNEDPKLANILAPTKYEGILSKFLGPRWWRSRIELLLWEITEGQSGDPAVVRNRLNNLIDRKVGTSKPAVHPIVCLNSNYQRLESFYSIHDSVRIRPDDWPPYADQAWTTIELAKNEPKLRSLVLTEDLERLKN
jgi:CheY-like chemotaxis protein